MDISNQEKLWKLNLLFLLGAVALSACSLGAHRVRSIQVASAIYSVEDGTIPCDVTARVAGICNGLASCTVSVQSALCHMGDPAPRYRSSSPFTTRVTLPARCEPLPWKAKHLLSCV